MEKMKRTQLMALCVSISVFMVVTLAVPRVLMEAVKREIMLYYERRLLMDTLTGIE